MSFVQVIKVGEITPEVLLLVWGFLQALLTEYVPGLAPRYAALSDEWKRFSQAIALAVITAAVFGLGCANVISVACTQANAIELVVAWVVALMANQTSHRVFRKAHKTDPA